MFVISDFLEELSASEKFVNPGFQCGESDGLHEYKIWQAMSSGLYQGILDSRKHFTYVMKVASIWLCSIDSCDLTRQGKYRILKHGWQSFRLRNYLICKCLSKRRLTVLVIIVWYLQIVSQFSIAIETILNVIYDLSLYFKY